MKAYILRGQGLGFITDKIFLGYPSKRDFDAVMQKELELHGFDIQESESADEAGAVDLRQRWVRAQEIDVVSEAECEALTTKYGRGPGEPNEHVLGQLSEQSFAELTKAPRESEGAAPIMSMTGHAHVTNAKP